MEKMHRIYGENPDPIVTDRVNTELRTILDHEYDVIYMSAQKLVQNSMEHGYLVGSRAAAVRTVCNELRMLAVGANIVGRQRVYLRDAGHVRHQ